MHNTRKILLFAIVTMLAPQANAQVTEFEDLALNGNGSTPFIRWEDEGNPDYFMVRFDDRFHFWTGIAYSVRFSSTATADTLEVNGDGVKVEKRLLVEGPGGGPAPVEMFALQRPGGSMFSFEDTSLNTKWFFSSSGTGAFNISLADSGGPEFAIALDGRVRMGPGSNTSFNLSPTGNLTLSGTLTQSSDRTRKTDVQDVDTKDVLAQVAALPVTTWRFKTDDENIRHMGPMSQDFHAAFGLGENELTIAPVDGVGVALAAIKALDSEDNEMNDRLATLEAQVTAQEHVIELLYSRLESLAVSSEQREPSAARVVHHQIVK